MLYKKKIYASIHIKSNENRFHETFIQINTFPNTLKFGFDFNTFVMCLSTKRHTKTYEGISASVNGIDVHYRELHLKQMNGL